jgi:2-octaprenyl-6-methoxyphenol hydroxylase
MNQAVDTERRDLVIMGGGLVGMTLALAAAKQGMTCHVVEKADPADLTAQGVDGRASAISSASWNLFTNIGLAEALAPLGCPIDAIAVTDQHKPGRIDFQPKPDEGTLGRMYSNRDIRLALFEAARNEPNIAWHTGVEGVVRERGAHGVSVTLSDGRVLEGSLLVGAEGRRSPTRDEEGIGLVAWDYHHTAIVTALAHEKPHGNVAWEIFYAQGPFALLPLKDLPDGTPNGRIHRSALVWTVPAKDGKGVMAMSETAFIAELSKRMEGMFGGIELISQRIAYPLSYQNATRIVGDRLALVGDAAHGMHPIAGQGLNLGLRDVGTLVEVLSEGMRLGLDAGDAQLLKRYENWRALDTFTTMSVVDGLMRIFGVPGRAASAVRRLGMGAMQRMPVLKTFFMNEARGVSGALPKLLQG